MNRRSFLSTGLASTIATVAVSGKAKALSDPQHSALRRPSSSALQRAMNPKPLTITTGLEPFVPSVELPWDERTAGHLLRRTTFQPTYQQIADAAKSTPQAAVDNLLDTTGYEKYYDPTIPTWYNEAGQRPTTQAEIQQYQMLLRSRMVELQGWWLNHMMNSPYQLVEKMTLFWHNHFPSDLQKVPLPQMMYRQNDLFRRTLFGSFKDLTKQIVYDPAMLVYLDGQLNTKNKPNENFGREVLELFTLGEGHYTEQDIVQASRVFTGWQVKDQYPYSMFDTAKDGVKLANLHDYGTKQFMGSTIKPSYVGSDTAKQRSAGMEESNTIVDVIFQQTFAKDKAEEDAGKPKTDVEAFKGKNVVGVFIASKLYQYFVYEITDDAIVAQLADLLVQNNFELKPVLRILLTSAHFYDVQLYGAIIKSPIEFMIGSLRQLSLALPTGNVLQRSFMPSLVTLGQEPLYPPNVAGWPGYRNWISTATYPLRNNIAGFFITGQKIGATQVPGVDIEKFSSWFASLNDLNTFLDDVVRYLLAIQLDPNERPGMMDALLQGSPDYDWPLIISNTTSKANHIKSLLTALLHLPEYQLM